MRRDDESDVIQSNDSLNVDSLLPRQSISLSLSLFDVSTASEEEKARLEAEAEVEMVVVGTMPRQRALGGELSKLDRQASRQDKTRRAMSNSVVGLSK